MEVVYTTFMPNYYGSISRTNQEILLIDNLYWFAADGVTKNASGELTPKAAIDEQMMMTSIMYGGRATPANMQIMVRRIDWVNGKVFAKYDSRDAYLKNKDFYCFTTQRRVYKCLDNNGGRPSTQQPTFTTTGPSTLADGYTWIYLYSLTEQQLLDYGVNGYIPVYEDPAVANSAVRGTITTVNVVSPGEYTETFEGIIQEIVSTNTVRISGSASPISDTYNNMGLYILSGAGADLSYKIAKYTANTEGRFVEVENDLTGVDIADSYLIAPYIDIIGNGMGGSVRPVMDGSSIDKIEIMNRGSEYTMADASISSNNTYTVTPAHLEVSLSPIRGHGRDVFNDLYVDNVMITVDLDDFVIDDIPVNEITFSKLGFCRVVYDGEDDILYTDPTFHNTFIVEISPNAGTLEVGDRIATIDQPVNGSGVLVFANSTHVIGTYDSPHVRMHPGFTVASPTKGIIGNIVSVVQPQVRLIDSDIVTIVDTTTIQRTADNRELLRIFIHIR